MLISDIIWLIHAAETGSVWSQCWTMICSFAQYMEEWKCASWPPSCRLICKPVNQEHPYILLQLARQHWLVAVEVNLLDNGCRFITRPAGHWRWWTGRGWEMWPRRHAANPGGNETSWEDWCPRRPITEQTQTAQQQFTIGTVTGNSRESWGVFFVETFWWQF